MQLNLFAKPTQDSCVRCSTVYCRLSPCTQANEVRCCAACSSKNCSSRCYFIKKGE